MSEPVTALIDERTLRIAELNDRCRLGLDPTGKIIVTSTCLATIAPSLDPASKLLAQGRILSAVRAVEFSADSPERDLAWFAIVEHKLMLKIDYYDLDLTFHSDDAADPAKTRRVMTVMLTSDY